MKKEIPIFFAIDSSYVPFVSVAIKSISENSSKDYDYKIIILHQELSKENKQDIMELETKNLKIRFVSMDKGLESITDRKENKLRCDYFTLTIYYRLFIPEMFPEYDKGIYIDSDVVANGDISKLYNIDLGDNIIGACMDNSIKDIEPLVKYVQGAVGVKMEEYINSGMLLMNIEEMRKNKFSAKFLELLNKYHFDSVAPDQDYINAICNGRIKYLDEEWDTMPNDARKELESPQIIHYNLFLKPWCYDNIQYEDYFWKYAKKTKFYDIICKIKKDYSKEQKEADKECLDNLIKRALEILDTEVTFKNLHEKGEKIRI